MGLSAPRRSRESANLITLQKLNLSGGELDLFRRRFSMVRQTLLLTKTLLFETDGMRTSLRVEGSQRMRLRCPEP